MSDRDDDARRLAEAMGWRFVEMMVFSPFTRSRSKAPPNGHAFVVSDDHIGIPAPDAPLPAMLEFVGRLCEALGDGFHVDLSDIRGTTEGEGTGRAWKVAFRPREWRVVTGWYAAPDLAWACIRAALAAKGAT